MNQRTNESTYLRTNEPTNKRTNEQTNQRTNHIFGIIINFIDGKIDGQVYHKLLQYHVFPQIRDKVSPRIFKRLYWQENGAPPHHYRKNNRYLNSVLRSQELWNNTGLSWPAHSPDLSVLDYWLNEDTREWMNDCPVEDMITVSNLLNKFKNKSSLSKKF